MPDASLRKRAASTLKKGRKETADTHESALLNKDINRIFIFRRCALFQTPFRKILRRFLSKFDSTPIAPASFV